ncbi:alpha/beta hydrolase [Lactococcus allomyrinae]|uniref:Alpha/beta hydrolase n=1 Tax=Lactococcus allomyrinae TaxID=2419773 RepID=A0A387BI32_9LACT|nr:alpha/beta hydrolase [Lactococcus allomyrinae]AYG00677.1 alpha/beta hydrolase [Lactococcus allomyrinae]
MIILWILLILLLLFLLFSLITFFVVEHKSQRVIDSLKPNHHLYQDSEKFLASDLEERSIRTQDGLKLYAWYLPAEVQTEKTVIVADGYHSIRARFAAYGWLFHQLGYNVLIPAYRASAEAAGHFIGFGWLDRDDYLRWMNQLIEQDSSVKIAMFGVSMGAASAMMVSGEPLPEQVKCFIADCGYDNVWNEIAFKAQHDFHLPAFPLVHLLSFWSKIFAGYDYKEASAVKQLEKNTRPFLFIHGEEDVFVPTEMVHRNFAATSAQKELLLIEDAGHAIAYETAPEIYREKVKDFLKKYL